MKQKYEIINLVTL